MRHVVVGIVVAMVVTVILASICYGDMRDNGSSVVSSIMTCWG